MAGLAVLGAIEFADIKLPGRSGDSVSLSDNLARIVAPINLDLVKQLSPRAVYHADTAEWRELWWEQIWISAQSTPMLEAFGHGYGFDLFSLAPPEVRGGQEKWEVRTRTASSTTRLAIRDGSGSSCSPLCSSPF